MQAWDKAPLCLSNGTIPNRRAEIDNPTFFLIAIWNDASVPYIFFKIYCLIIIGEKGSLNQ